MIKESAKLFELLRKHTTIDSASLLNLQQKLPFWQQHSASNINDLQRLFTLKNHVNLLYDKLMVKPVLFDEHRIFIWNCCVQLQKLANKSAKLIWSMAEEEPKLFSIAHFPKINKELMEKIFVCAHADKETLSVRFVTFWKNLVHIFNCSKTSTLKNSFTLQALLLELLFNPVSFPILYDIQSLSVQRGIHIDVVCSDSHSAHDAAALTYLQHEPLLIKRRYTAEDVTLIQPPRRGCSNLVLYHDDDNFQSRELDFVNENMQFRLGSTPPMIAFFHELIHLLHVLQGIDNHARNFLGKPDQFIWTSFEEWLTIDGGPSHDQVSENDLRRELGWPIRVTHKSIKFGQEDSLQAKYKRETVTESLIFFEAVHLKLDIPSVLALHAKAKMHSRQQKPQVLVRRPSQISKRPFAENFTNIRQSAV